MLPLTHLFDSYRAGLAVILANLKPVLVIAAVIFAISIYSLHLFESVSGGTATGFAVTQIILAMVL
ncbi:MAG: hypothetical protein AAF415_02435 [Pseudomonadota bacterium]